MESLTCSLDVDKWIFYKDGSMPNPQIAILPFVISRLLMPSSVVIFLFLGIFNYGQY